MFYRIIPLVNSYLCYKKKKTFVLSCLFLSGIVVLRCFGHVYKLDCEQLKLVCQSIETWLQITLLFHTVKVRLGNVKSTPKSYLRKSKYCV